MSKDEREQIAREIRDFVADHPKDLYEEAKNSNLYGSLSDMIMDWVEEKEEK